MSFHYNGANIYLLMVKNSILATQLCLGSISKDWKVDNMKKAVLNGYAYQVSVDYDVVPTASIPHTYNCLMIINGMLKYETA